MPRERRSGRPRGSTGALRRRVVALLEEGVPSGTIAQTCGTSPSNVSHIREREMAAGNRGLLLIAYVCAWRRACRQTASHTSGVLRQISRYAPAAYATGLQARSGDLLASGVGIENLRYARTLLTDARPDVGVRLVTRDDAGIPWSVRTPATLALWRQIAGDREEPTWDELVSIETLLAQAVATRDHGGARAAPRGCESDGC